MRTRRSGPARVPGFPDPATQPAAPADPSVPAPASPAAPAPAPVSSAPPERLHPRAGTRQLNVRVLAPLLQRYKRLLRDLDDDGFETNLTEVIHALLHQGPSDADAVRAAVRAWRRTLDEG